MPGKMREICIYDVTASFRSCVILVGQDVQVCNDSKQRIYININTVPHQR